MLWYIMWLICLFLWTVPSSHSIGTTWYLMRGLKYWCCFFFNCCRDWWAMTAVWNKLLQTPTHWKTWGKRIEINCQIVQWFPASRTPGPWRVSKDPHFSWPKDWRASSGWQPAPRPKTYWHPKTRRMLNTRGTRTNKTQCHAKHT